MPLPRKPARPAWQEPAAQTVSAVPFPPRSAFVVHPAQLVPPPPSSPESVCPYTLRRLDFWIPTTEPFLAHPGGSPSASPNLNLEGPAPPSQLCRGPRQVLRS